MNRMIAQKIQSSVKQELALKFHQSLTEAPMNNKNFKLMPKIKLKNPSKETEKLRQQKIEAKELKSGIARYLLAHISK